MNPRTSRVREHLGSAMYRLLRPPSSSGGGSSEAAAAEHEDEGEPKQKFEREETRRFEGEQGEVGRCAGC